MRQVPRIALTVFIVLVLALFGTMLVLYSMVRHRPALYRPPEAVPAARRESDFQAFLRIQHEAEEQFKVDGAFTASATTDQLNAAIAHYEAMPAERERLHVPPDLRNVQVALQNGRAVVMALVPSDAGSIVVSAYVTVAEGPEPRLKVGDVRVGSLRVPRERVAPLIEKIERLRFAFETPSGNGLRVTRIKIEDGRATATGVKEMP